MLGGRFNSVVRQLPRQFANSEYRGEQWEEIPVHPYG
jgi:hypothetical protein